MPVKPERRFRHLEHDGLGSAERKRRALLNENGYAGTRSHKPSTWKRK